MRTARRAPRPAGRGLRSAARGGRARLGPARDDAPARHETRAPSSWRRSAASRTSGSSTPRSGRLLDACEPLVEELPYDSDDRSLVRVTRRDWEKARRVPTELRTEMTREAARGHHAWVEARRTNDFASFLPYLRTNLELKRRYVECFEWSDSPYTPLLDDYEPGMLTTEVRDGVRGAAAGADRDRRLRPEVDASFLHGDFPPERQRAFAERVIATLGFEDSSWRLDPTAHPFCTSFSNRDVRLTTRYQPDDLESVWSSLHEAGHGLYAHGIADTLLRTPLAGAPSLGVNESQSRTWENLVGRSRPVLGALVRAAPGDVPERSRRRAGRRSSARSTAPSPG